MKLVVWLVALFALGAVLSARGPALEAGAGEISKVWWLDSPDQISGAEVPEASSTLQRGYFSMTVYMHTTSLTGGHNYSVWWVIFQNPGACNDGCGDDDINAVVAGGPNPAGIGVHFGGVFTAPADGRISLSSRILEDTVESCARALPYSLVCAPLRDAATANALVFLVDNGPSVEGAAPSIEFNAGCRALVWFGYVVAQYNNGPYNCYRAQSTYHTP
jgi:hypothetical protein